MSSNNRTPFLTIAECLETFEDTLFSNKRTQGFQHLHLILQEHSVNVTSQEILRILAVFEKCLKLDTQSIPYALTTVLSMLKNPKVISNIPAQDLLPSALAVLQMLKTLCTLETQNLRTMGVKVFLSYPVDVLTMIIRQDCLGVQEIFKHLTPQIFQGASATFHIFLKLLFIKTPPNEKQQLLQDGLPTWFNVIGVIMEVCSTVSNDDDATVDHIGCLEVLTEALANVDYFTCAQWQNEILKCICDSKMYPLTIMRKLQKNSNYWHRLWIVFIKLLRNQVTRNCTYGTPIQPMLEVVETAFKMDPKSRCRAFQCWDALIDGLSSDTNPKSIPRYLRLLLIPLKPNNAKTEDTAQAKFYTWWNLIRKFQPKLDQFRNEVLLEFLHFMFGKKAYDKKHVPYQLTAGAGRAYGSLGSLCLQTFAEIVGHDVNCNCCTDVPKLNEKMLNNKLLASHWDEWMSALKTAILITNTIYQDDNDVITNELMHILCVWRAFVISIAELPPNGVRKDMWDELIQVLMDLLQECNTADTMPNILFSLTLSLMEDNESIRKLMATKGDEQPLRKIMAIVVNPKMDKVFRRYETTKMVKILKPLTDFAMISLNLDCLLASLTFNHSSLTLWTAVADSINEAKTSFNVNVLRRVLMWPVLAMQHIDVDKHAAMAWQTLYYTYANKANNTEFDRSISQHIKAGKDKSYLKIIIAACILKNSILYPQEDIGVYSKILENVTTEIMGDYKLYKEAVPVFVDTIVLMLDKVLSTVDEELAKLTLNCVKNTVLMFFGEINSQDNTAGIVIDPNALVMLDNIFKALQGLNKMPAYSHIFCSFLDVLTEQVMPLNKKSALFKYVLSKLNYLRQNCLDDSVKAKIDGSIEMLTNTIAKFTSPNANVVLKRSKKKAVIVNTVTENGEEYAVVKSNWKFNPKNLTENQKEKLQRKREDIPALYQDLSQSQDEFKLSKWKTDSQDTTTSTNSKSSKLTTNDNASEILKNIQSSDLVPNIMQNILSENDKNHTSSTNETNTATDKSVKVGRSSPCTPKSSKSPRMALKDRVFRNVRNLIEKSSPKNKTSDSVMAECQLRNTPSPKKTDNANVINSAPPVISVERPSRVKRIPKKFADVQLFSLKKRRNSFEPNSENHIQFLDDINQGDNNENTDGSKCGIDSSNEVIVQHNVGHSNVIDVKEAESVGHAQELIIIPVSQHKTTECVLDTTISDNLCGTHNNEDISDIQKKYDDPNSDNKNKHDEHQKADVENNLNSQNLQVTSEEEVAQDTQENNGSQDCQKNSDNVQDVQMDDVAQNSDKIDLKDKVTDVEHTVELNNETGGENKEIATLKTPVQKSKQPSQKSTAKKSTKRSRIEKELAIDMVEGHPYLKPQSEKRLTRKKLLETENTRRRKSVPLKPNKTKPQTKSIKSKEKDLKPNCHESVTVEETQEKNTLPEEAPCSEDVIESSQDSNFTTITVKPTKRILKRLVLVSVERLEDTDLRVTNTQELLQDSDCEMLETINLDTKDDIELPQNKTAEVDKNHSELTENMDTEPVIDDKITDEVIIINCDSETPITISSKNIVGLDTEELAEADTQPNDPADFVAYETSPAHPEIQNTGMDITESMSASKLAITACESQDVVVLTEPNCCEKDTDICSPFKDDAKRKQDFLNNTLEISPIKVRSPNKEDTSPEKNEETSSDYLVVKLSSPVHSNGEPFVSKGSPEFFTEDKTSPDKRDQSPPRAEVVPSSSSPSSSLSLKKNRTQTLRPIGRAAHMVGLCVPDSMTSKKNSEKCDSEEAKKPNTSTPARRNLRVLYNAVNDSSDISEDKEQVNFLKLKKALPSVDSSPAVPILKRKIDIVDDSIASPAIKRKRVSFHDPPVSTTVSVQKYIKPDCIEPPSHKRLEVQMTRSVTKSPKRIDNTLKLDTVLSKAIESFIEQPVDSLTNDTNTSLDVTPAVEVVITSELNDTDPICQELVDCKDPIENIAVELSSPAMKDLFIKELDGQVLTVGDLAKMTELEVNRLCIKAPKVQVAKKMLACYVKKRVVTIQEVPVDAMIIADETAIAKEMTEDMTEPEAVHPTVAIQTNDVERCDTAAQTRTEIMKLASTQTTSASTVDTKSQTLETGYKPTSEIITTCLSEREDFITKLSEYLPTDTIIDILVNKSEDSKLVLTKFLDRQGHNMPNKEKNSKEFLVLRDLLLTRFEHRDLILFCSRLLQGLHDKSS